MTSKDISAEDLYIEQAKDALHILPLEMISLQTPPLRRLCLVKDARLETKVELYRGQESGKGLVDCDKLIGFFPAHKEALKQDVPKIQALSTLSSFDVFSLRIGLRRLGIDVNDMSYLTLSPRTQEKLSQHMREFTKPLLVRVYGSADQRAAQFSDLVGLFRNPDRGEALKNLKQMSSALQVDLAEIPAFLEDYGDMFLSVAYYRSNFEEARGLMTDFVAWTEGISNNMHLSRDKDLMLRCETARESVDVIHYSLLNRLGIFQERFGTFWQDINRQSFHEIRDLITSNYQSLGGALCGVSVKMKAWRQKFPTAAGAPNNRADFVVAEIFPGLSRLTEMVGDIRV